MSKSKAERSTTEVRAVAKKVRLSAQKARLVADLIRGMDVNNALYQLDHSVKKAAQIIKKVVQSAAANAENNKSLDIDDLWIKEIFVNKAMVMKRLRARAKGRGDRILKPSCHITVCVDEKNSKRGG